MYPEKAGAAWRGVYVIILQRGIRCGIVSCIDTYGATLAGKWTKQTERERTTISRTHLFFGGINFFRTQIFSDQSFLGELIFESQTILVQKNVGPKKLWSEQMLVKKNYESQIIVGT